MAEPTPGPSSARFKYAGYVPKSAPENLRILRRVITKVNNEIEGKFCVRRPIPVEFTGLQPDFIEKLTNEYTEDIEIKIREVERSVVYHQLMDLYIYEKIMPTTYHLFLKLYGKIPAHMDLGEFRNYLLKNGFMWKQILRGTCVVIENPKVVFERYSYLKSILDHRKQEKPIFFIEEVAFNSKGEILTMKQSMSRNSEPQIRLIFAVSAQGVQVKQFVNNFNPETFLKWINDTLLKFISKPSVIVVNNNKHHCQEVITLPNEDSLKKEMCDWLEYFDVPHDPGMPKAVLFELVQKYTDISKKIYVVDSIMRQHEHEVLRLPDCIIKLTPGTYCFDMLRVNMPELLKEYLDVDPDVITTSICQIIDAMTEDHLGQYSEVVVAEEQLTLLKDGGLDNMLDELENVMRNASAENNGLDSELPSGNSDSE